MIRRLLLLLSFLIVQTVHANPVAHWKLDEGQGLVAHDSSGSGADGLLNGPVWMARGLWFDGVNDYIEVGDPPALELTSSMSIVAWVNAERLSEETDVLIAKTQGYGDVGWYLYLEHGFPAMKIGHPNELSKTSTRTSTVHLNLGRWYHVVGVFNAPAKTLDMYVDGVLTNGLLNGIVPSSQRNAQTNVTIGQRPNGKRPFKGLLDDIRIYDRALSAQEIATLAEGDDPPPPTVFSARYEAESFQLLVPFTVGSDPQASSGSYIAATSGKSTKTPKREGTLAFSVPDDGTYYLWARLKAPSGKADAVYVGIDQSWDRVYTLIRNSYVWLVVKEFSLTAGSHVIQIGHGELNARLDVLFLTNDSGEVPQ